MNREDSELHSLKGEVFDLRNLNEKLKNENTSLNEKLISVSNIIKKSLQKC